MTPLFGLIRYALAAQLLRHQGRECAPQCVLFDGRDNHTARLQKPTGEPPGAHRVDLCGAGRPQGHIENLDLCSGDAWGRPVLVVEGECYRRDCLLAGRVPRVRTADDVEGGDGEAPGLYFGVINVLDPELHHRSRLLREWLSIGPWYTRLRAPAE